MKVKEVIRQLRQLDPEAEIIDVVYVRDEVAVKKLPGIQIVTMNNGKQIMVIRVNSEIN